MQIKIKRGYALFLILLLSMIAGCDSSSNSVRIEIPNVTTLNFGQVHVYDATELSFEVYCRSSEPLIIEKIDMQSGAEYVVVKVLDNTGTLLQIPYTCELYKDEKITVHVAFAPLNMGNLYDSVQIYHDATNEDSPLLVACEGEGLIPLVPDMNVTPPSQLDFGTVKLCMNQTSDQTIDIENNGTYELEISEIKLENDVEFKIKKVLDFNGQALLAPYNTNVQIGEKIEVTVTFTPSEVKIVNEKLVIKHNDPNKASPYNVDFIGEGAAPTISVKDTKIVDSNGSVRAIGYSMSNRIITGGGKIFVTWLDNNLAAKIMSYDIAGSTWSSPVTVGTNISDKTGPVITMDASGHIYFLHGPDNGLFTITRTVTPYDITGWQRTRTFGDNASYPSMVCDKTNTVHCAYRGGQSPQKLYFQTYTNGSTWTNPLELVNCGANSSSTQYGNSLAVSPNGDLHLGFHIYDTNGVTAGKYAGYLRSKDGGRTWETADGSPVNLPANPNTSCFMEQGSNLNMRVNNVAIDDKGNPWLAVTHLEGNPTLKLCHHDGNSWQMIDLLPELQKNLPGKYLSEGTISFDDTGMLYVHVCTLDSGYSTWYGDRSHEVVMFASADHGKTFQFLQISQTDPYLANWMPVIERPYGPNPIGVPGLLFAHSDKNNPPAEVIFKSFEKK